MINDTIITAALKVARAKLDGFVAPSNKIVNPDAQVPSTWHDLIEQIYIQSWKMDYSETHSLASEIRFSIDNKRAEQDHFVEIYHFFNG